ncbi:hypothetical protein [Aquirhabdus sp.]|uniref:DUF7832 domain-containing protein n=1 Tax=Aquirhabdus sp. TaxID=2824160 RepID=UPI00396CFFD2
MKYDDASWHFGGNFPPKSPQEFGGTHIALLLKWCFIKGWAGDLHLEDPESNNDVEYVKQGQKSGTDFLFQWCDGKFTDEDLNDEGNAFIQVYYGEAGKYLNDYANKFGPLMYIGSEDQHDFKKFSNMVEKRYQSFIKPKSNGWYFWRK